MQNAATISRRGKYDNRHSARVARLKVLLPLIALVILSTVFLLADRPDSGDGASFGRGNLEAGANGRIVAPDYSGVAENGAALYLTAARARPLEPGGEIAAEQLRGTWEGTRGGRVVVTSDNGRLGADGKTATLTGTVDIVSDSGFHLTSRRMEIDGAVGRLVSPGPVEGIGPPGRIDAGAMEVEQAGGHPFITFTGGVKVLYEPGSSEGD